MSRLLLPISECLQQRLCTLGATRRNCRLGMESVLKQCASRPPTMVAPTLFEARRALRWGVPSSWFFVLALWSQRRWSSSFRYMPSCMLSVPRACPFSQVHCVTRSTDCRRSCEAWVEERCATYREMVCSQVYPGGPQSTSPGHSKLSGRLHVRFVCLCSIFWSAVRFLTRRTGLGRNGETALST